MGKRAVEPYGMVSVYDTLHHWLNFYLMEDKPEDSLGNRKREKLMYHLSDVSFLRCVLSKVFTPKSLRLIKCLLVKPKLIWHHLCLDLERALSTTFNN